MITVENAPGGSDPIHRHNAHAFLYVLEGSVVMQVKGGKEVTRTPGQTFSKVLTMFMSLAGTQVVKASKIPRISRQGKGPSGVGP